MTHSNPTNNSDSKLNPGSDEAMDKGCTCPVLDNNHGRGVGDPPQFWMNGDCPLHGFPAKSLEKEGV